MLTYRNLGPAVQQQFANSFGVSYGVGAAAEWQEIGKEVAKGLVILFILERLYLTRPVSWLEEVRAARPVLRVVRADACSPPPQHVDYLSLQALFFRHSGLSLLGQARLLYTYKRRISDQ